MQALVVSSSRGEQYDQNPKQFSDLKIQYFFVDLNTLQHVRLFKTNEWPTKILASVQKQLHIM